MLGGFQGALQREFKNSFPYFKNDSILFWYKRFVNSNGQGEVE